MSIFTIAQPFASTSRDGCLAVRACAAAGTAVASCPCRPGLWACPIQNSIRRWAQAFSQQPWRAFWLWVLEQPLRQLSGQPSGLNPCFGRPRALGTTSAGGSSVAISSVGSWSSASASTSAATSAVSAGSTISSSSTASWSNPGGATDSNVIAILFSHIFFTIWVQVQKAA